MHGEITLAMQNFDDGWSQSISIYLLIVLSQYLYGQRVHVEITWSQQILLDGSMRQYL